MKKDARVAETVDMTGFQNGVGGNLTASRNISKFAFTMAELLLSLTIIGVVAAITLPALMGNITAGAGSLQSRTKTKRYGFGCVKR